MDFFDKKEDVLDFQLTEYGKRLLEQGNLKPEYYAFYDEDILYDSNAGGFSESQNEAARRIKYETPSLRVQTNTTGVETRVNEFLLQVTGTIDFPTVSENSVAFVNAFQDTPHFAQKHFLGADPLGTSDLKTQYAPAWHINCLANEISSSQDYYTANLTSSGGPLGSSVVRNIPQINITIDYKTFFSDSPPEDFLDNNIQGIDDFISDTSLGLYVQENYLVLEVQEKNTDYLKENFDIEVFQVLPGTASESPGLERLQFVNEENLLNPTDTKDVENYINILTDGEIPENIAASLGINNALLNGTAVRVQLNRDMYQTDNEEPC